MNRDAWKARVADHVEVPYGDEPMRPPNPANFGDALAQPFADQATSDVAELIAALEQHRVLVRRYAVALRRIADPEVFDANWAAMRVEAREALEPETHEH